MKLANRIAPIGSVSVFSLSDLGELFQRRMARLSNAKRIRVISTELPDFLLVFALSVKSGASVAITLSYLAHRTGGQIGKQLKDVLTSTDLGASLVEELREITRRLPSLRLEEMTQTLISNLEFGAAISDSLLEQSKSCSEEQARSLAKRAASNETKMLIPTIFLILPITVLFAIFPSLAMLTEAI